MQVKRGEIYLDTNFGAGRGSEQAGRRPCIVVSNDLCNKHSPAITVVPITKQTKTKIPTHFDMPRSKFSLPDDSIALVEQVRTIDKSRLGARHMVKLDREQLAEINEMIKIQLGVN